MAEKPNPEFGKRRRAEPPRPAIAAKRSNHVALLVMGTLAVGGSAYALMPREDCRPASPGMAAPAVPQAGTECAPRSSSSGSGGRGGGGSSSRSSFFSGESGASSSTSPSSSVSRGGFGSFAHAFGYSGG
ncbi:hypothetical protein [Bradyrhizobium lablabi]|uniref:hypothetical protein n=1 Tax=Bradyrhizobium lablabi TaxID=722472 RepID=UPI001BA7A004|nr:hypothetical protein [Bradyrhizobium lablabi]MBR0697678.1 hypothetical protein [Bradyrhizobium lablabi]